MVGQFRLALVGQFWLALKRKDQKNLYGQPEAKG